MMLEIFADFIGRNINPAYTVTVYSDDNEIEIAHRYKEQKLIIKLDGTYVKAPGAQIDISKPSADVEAFLEKQVKAFTNFWENEDA